MIQNMSVSELGTKTKRKRRTQTQGFQKNHTASNAKHSQIFKPQNKNATWPFLEHLLCPPAFFTEQTVAIVSSPQWGHESTCTGPLLSSWADRLRKYT